MSRLLSPMLALLRADNYFTSLAQYVLFNLLLLTAGIAILAVWKKLNILSFDRWFTNIWESLRHGDKKNKPNQTKQYTPKH